MILTCLHMFHIFYIPIKEMPFGAPNPKEQQIPLRFKIFVHPFMKRGKSVPGYVQDNQSCTTFTGNPVLCPLKINVISVTSLITSVTTLCYITWMYKDELNSFTILFTIIITLIYSLHFRRNSSWYKVQSI